MLPQSVPAAGAPVSMAVRVRRASRSWNTQRAYAGQWNRFRRWTQAHGLELPEVLEAALCDYMVHLAGEGRRMATIRQARAAIIKGAPAGRLARSPGLRCLGDHAGLGPSAPGASEAGGAPPVRCAGCHPRHCLHLPPHPGRQH